MSKKVWKIDPAHCEVRFRARHMLVSNVTGQFNRFDATAETDGDSVENAHITFTAETASVDTGVEQRNNHLRSDDFFNSEKYPVLTFRSTSFKKMKDDNYQLKGDLTIRDITKPVEFAVEFGGEIKDPYGNQRRGFTVAGKINRKEFGLKYNALLETGGAVVSDEIKVDCHVEFIYKD